MCPGRLAPLAAPALIGVHRWFQFVFCMLEGNFPGGVVYPRGGLSSGQLPQDMDGIDDNVGHAVEVDGVHGVEAGMEEQEGVFFAVP